VITAGNRRTNHRRLAAHQFRRQCRQLIAVAVGPAIFDRHVATLDLAGLGEPLHEGAHALRERFGRLGAEIGDDLRCGLLREGGERQVVGDGGYVTSLSYGERA
jgi:hypothetical protein